MALLAAMREAGVRKLVFSSTAATYGEPEQVPIVETAPTRPTNPYGASKLAVDHMITGEAAAHGLGAVSLRYFNVAGADPDGRAGQSTAAATHLIKVAVEAALGKRSEVVVFGQDYATPDGTGIRDYIHVSDLAEAHVAALDRLVAEPAASLTLNCGYGRGHSVLEVLDAVERVAKRKLTRRMAARRPGDPAALVADNARVLAALDWRPRHQDLDIIVSHALAWEKSLAR